MKIVVKSHRRKLSRRTQWSATFYHWNGQPMFRTTESYNNIGDLYKALVSLYTPGAVTITDEKGLTIKFPDSAKGEFLVFLSKKVVRRD